MMPPVFDRYAVPATSWGTLALVKDVWSAVQDSGIASGAGILHILCGATCTLYILFSGSPTIASSTVTQVINAIYPGTLFLVTPKTRYYKMMTLTGNLTLVGAVFAVE